MRKRWNAEQMGTRSFAAAAFLLLLLTALLQASPTLAIQPDTDQSDETETSTSEEPVPQRDVMDVLDEWLFGRRVEPELTVHPKTGLQWALLPTFSYNPVYGAAFGALVSGAGRRGSTKARYSSISVSGNVSTQGQVQFLVRGDVFSPSEDYLVKADFRHLDTERSTWGLGEIRTQEGEYPMSFLLRRFYTTILRKVRAPVYFGVGFHFDHFEDIVDTRAQDGEQTPYTDYSGGAPSVTQAVGLSLNVLADTRDNLVNPTAGYYLNWSMRNYATSLGSDENWQESWMEARLYPHLPSTSKNVLAFWMYNWFTFGPAPYLNLPTNGWDTYGRGARGYLAGRIRGVNQLYLESEYRWTISRDGLWGAVTFVNVTATTSPDTGTFGPLDPGAGAGLRLKFNKHSSTNLALDYAWGREDSSGFFMGMTEVF